MIFLKENVTALVKAAADPDRAIMATVMGVPPVMESINNAWKEYCEDKQDNQKADVEM